MKSGRTFTASLKPVLTDDQVKGLFVKTTGMAKVWVIEHDKDTDDNGELIEAHTHVMIEYDTPRKVSTVANLLGVASNFVEVVQSKKAMLRYLIHLDDPDKFQYHMEDVRTNSAISYEEEVAWSSLSDREIAQLLVEGRGLELLGVVSASKLRTIQAFLQYDKASSLYREIKELNDKMSHVVQVFDDISTLAHAVLDEASPSLERLTHALTTVAKAVDKARLQAQTSAHRKR